MSGTKNKIQLTYEESHKMEGGVLYKLCNRCNEWFPCTEEYFYKRKTNKTDGLFPYCKECSKKKFKQWINDNEEHFRNYVKERDSNLTEKRILQKRKVANKQRLSGYQSEYRKTHKDKIKQYVQNREQHKTHKISKKEWETCKNYFNNQCAYCGLSIENHLVTYRGITKQGDFHREHVDHNGANDLGNCIPSCKSCNSAKHTFTLEEWYNENNINYSKERLDKIHKWLNEDYKEYIKAN